MSDECFEEVTEGIEGIEGIDECSECSEVGYEPIADDILLPLEEECDADTALKDIKCVAHAFDMKFHPREDTKLLGLALVTGEVVIYRYAETDRSSVGFISLRQLHKQSCRSFDYFPSGEKFISGSADKRCIVSTENESVWQTEKERDGITAVAAISETVFASGDESGVVEFWDTRHKSAKKPSATFTFEDCDDWVSKIILLPDSSYIAAIRGDVVSFYDVRRPAKPYLVANTDTSDRDLYCVNAIRNGSKVLCGNNGGRIVSFSSQRLSHAENSIRVCSSAVNDIVVLEDEVVVAGCGDGLLRIVTFFPEQINGFLGQQRDDAESVESLAISPDEKIVASFSMDEKIRFFHASKALKLSKGSRNPTKRRKKETVPNPFFDFL